MLVLSRKIGEKLIIGDNITVTINRVSGNRITLGIEAPQNVRIVRGELAPLVEAPAVREDAQSAVVAAGYSREDVASASVPRLAK